MFETDWNQIFFKENSQRNCEVNFQNETVYAAFGQRWKLAVF